MDGVRFGSTRLPDRSSVSATNWPEGGLPVVETGTNAVFLEVGCGQVFTTTVNGVIVVIDTRGERADPTGLGKPVTAKVTIGEGEWKLPDPPSGGDGMVAMVRLNPTTDIFDLGALTHAVRADVLGEHVRPLRSGQSAAIEVLGPRGGRGSLDAMVIRPDA
jgi:hypothetical protein